MNGGERDELIAILKLIDMKINGIPFDGMTINSIMNGNVICVNPPSGVTLSSVLNMDDPQLLTHAALCGVSKAPGGAKSDISINNIGYSIKSNRAGPPALINHTSRPGFEAVCKRVGSNINQLDQIISQYWLLRKSGQIAEDVKNSSSICPFYSHKAYMRPILNYFLFTGTGQKNSAFPAEKILEVIDPLNEKSWKVFDKNNALDLFWDKLVFSLRAKKGMPAGYPTKMSAKALLTKSSVDVWTEFIDGDYRGALHIRATK